LIFTLYTIFFNSLLKPIIIQISLHLLQHVIIEIIVVSSLQIVKSW